MFGDTSDQVRKELPPFIGGRNIKIDQLIGTIACIFSSQLHRIAHINHIFEVNSIYGKPVPDIQTGYDSLGQHLNYCLVYSFPG